MRIKMMKRKMIKMMKKMRRRKEMKRRKRMMIKKKMTKRMRKEVPRAKEKILQLQLFNLCIYFSRNHSLQTKKFPSSNI